MKAKELIPILQLNPEAEIVVSTVEYRERSYQDVGYTRSTNQVIENVRVIWQEGVICLDGGIERSDYEEDSDE